MTSVSQAGITNASVLVTFNSPALSLDFPSLVWANDFTITLVHSLKIDALQTNSGSLMIFDGDLESISAPELVSVGGHL